MKYLSLIRQPTSPNRKIKCARIKSAMAQCQNMFGVHKLQTSRTHMLANVSLMFICLVVSGYCNHPPNVHHGLVGGEFERIEG